MKQVVILRGIPGCGKSTFADLLRWSRSHAVICSADHFFTSPDGTYKFDRTMLGKAHMQCQQKFQEAISLKAELIIVDNTNVDERDMTFYEEKAKEASYQVTHIIVENRHNGVSVHNVPDETITRMVDRFKVKLK